MPFIQEFATSIKRRLQVASAFCLLWLCTVGYAQSIRLDAKDARLSGPNVILISSSLQGITSTNGGSSDSYLTGFLSNSDTASFKPVSPDGGIYRLVLRYRSTQRKGYELKVNDLRLQGILTPTAKGEFAIQSLGLVELKAGVNDIVIDKGWGFYDVCGLELLPTSPQPMPPIAPYSLRDGAATKETIALLQRLQSTYGKRTMLGVYADSDAQYVAKTTGVKPSIMGGDLLRYS